MSYLERRLFGTVEMPFNPGADDLKDGIVHLQSAGRCRCVLGITHKDPHHTITVEARHFASIRSDQLTHAGQETPYDLGGCPLLEISDQGGRLSKVGVENRRIESSRSPCKWQVRI